MAAVTVSLRVDDRAHYADKALRHALDTGTGGSGTVRAGVRNRSQTQNRRRCRRRRSACQQIPAYHALTDPLFPHSSSRLPTFFQSTTVMNIHANAL